jgi:hypothetical protein
MHLRILFAQYRLVPKFPKSRRGRPTLHLRDDLLRHVAKQIEGQGYPLTRNEATRDAESAASIMAMALRHLGTPLSESQINAILGSNERRPRR